LVFKFMQKISLLVLMLLSVGSVAEVIDGEDLVDPTRPLGFVAGAFNRGTVATPSVTRSYQVGFIRASSTSPLAVINGQRVTIGDVVGNATVIVIDRNGVTLEVNGEELRVDLSTGSIRTQPDNP